MKIIKERIFVKKAIDHIQLGEYIRSKLKDTKCSKVEIQYTPLGTRIVVHTTTPGLVIGAGGERIREIVDEIKSKFGVENPQIDVQKIENPDIDPTIVAQNIAFAIERGLNFKRIGNEYLERVMRAGAIGCEIVIAGKVAAKARTERFIAGYLKKAGDPAVRDVVIGTAVANPAPGNIGIKVKIMIKHSDKKIEVPTPKVAAEIAEG